MLHSWTDFHDFSIGTFPAQSSFRRPSVVSAPVPSPCIWSPMQCRVVVRRRSIFDLLSLILDHIDQYKYSQVIASTPASTGARESSIDWSPIWRRVSSSLYREHCFVKIWDWQSWSLISSQPTTHTFVPHPVSPISLQTSLSCWTCRLEDSIWSDLAVSRPINTWR